MSKMRSIPLPAPVASIYRAVKKLEKMYPERKFTPDGHLLGALGEVVAAKAFRLRLSKQSSPKYDAIDPNGVKVQVKITAGDRVGLYSPCRRLIVLRIGFSKSSPRIPPKSAIVVYDGDGFRVWKASGKRQKNGQRSIRLSRLSDIAEHTRRNRK